MISFLLCARRLRSIGWLTIIIYTLAGVTICLGLISIVVTGPTSILFANMSVYFLTGTAVTSIVYLLLNTFFARRPLIVALIGTYRPPVYKKGPLVSFYRGLLTDDLKMAISEALFNPYGQAIKLVTLHKYIDRRFRNFFVEFAHIFTVLKTRYESSTSLLESMLYTPNRHIMLKAELDQLCGQAVHNRSESFSSSLQVCRKIVYEKGQAYTDACIGGVRILLYSLAILGVDTLEDMQNPKLLRKKTELYLANRDAPCFGFLEQVIVCPGHVGVRTRDVYSAGSCDQYYTSPTVYFEPQIDCWPNGSRQRVYNLFDEIIRKINTSSRVTAMRLT